MGTSTTAIPKRRQQKTVRAGLAVVLGLVLVQLVPVPPRRNPSVDRGDTIEANVRLTAEAKDVIRRACANCHSNETRWPWYSRVAPGSWMVGRHVERGRKALNFSEWRTRTQRKPGAAMASLAAACAAAASERMPPPSYLWFHPEARLSPADKQALCAWTDAEIAAIITAARNRPGAVNKIQIYPRP